MPEVTNFTPYPNFRYYSNDSQNRQFGVVVVKATFELASSGRLVVAEEQAPLVFTDLCHGPVNVTSLWHPSGHGSLQAGDGRHRQCGCTCAGRADRNLPGNAALRLRTRRICGLRSRSALLVPREWKPRWRRKLDEKDQREWQRHLKAFERWELTEPAPISELPLHYEYAFGGEVPQGPIRRKLCL